MRIGQLSPRTYKRTVLSWFGILLACFTSMMISFVLGGGRADASTWPTVNINAVVGFSSYYGQNHWVPVTVTIHNVGAARQIALSLDVNYATDNARTAATQLEWPVSMPANSWRKVQIGIPGAMINSNTTLDCIAEGQVVSTASLVGNALRNVAMVAVLSSTPSDAQFLSGATDGATGEPVLAIPIDNTSIPSIPTLYSNLTAIAATPSALASLSVLQQRALDEWVRLGGFLIVMGADATASSYWSHTFPLIPGAPHYVSGHPLADYAGVTTSVAPKVLSYAKGLRPGATAWSPMSSNNPLIGVMDVGRGKIIQTAFKPFQKELLIWSGSSPLWTTVLRQGDAGSFSALPALLDPSGALTLAQAASTLSPMRVPSLGFWASVFFLYIVLIGPILFFILRRRKKEAWAWVILPTVSIALSLGIYSFGASERPAGPLVAGVGVLDLVGDGTAESYGVGAFMSPNILSAKMTVPGSLFALPLTETNVRQGGDATVTESNRTQVSFENIGRWRVRYLYTAGSLSGQGRLDVKLESSFGILSGIVMNDTSYALQNVGLFWDGHMYQLGDLKPGDIVALTNETPVEDAISDWLSNYSSYNRDITRGLGHTLGSYAAAENMFNSDIPNESAMIVATTTSKVPSLPIVSKAASSQTMVLVRQYVPVTVDQTGGIS